MNCVAFDRLSQNKSSCSTSSHKELVDSETEGNLATTNEKARPFNSALSVWQSQRSIKNIKAIRSINPRYEICIHDDQDEYRNAEGDNQKTDDVNVNDPVVPQIVSNWATPIVNTNMSADSELTWLIKKWANHGEFVIRERFNFVLC